MIGLDPAEHADRLAIGAALDPARDQAAELLDSTCVECRLIVTMKIVGKTRPGFV